MRRISTLLASAGLAAALLAMGGFALADDDSNPPSLTLRVVSVQPDVRQIVGRGTNGEQKTVRLDSSTAIERHGPDPGGEAARGPMTLKDIAPGDRILVGGEQKGDVVEAKRIQVIGPASVDRGSAEREPDPERGVDEGRTTRGSGVGSGPGPGVPDRGSETD
jgi:hypothetical protein